MKQTLLLLVLALGICNINGIAQSKKQSTAVRSNKPKSTQIKKPVSKSTTQTKTVSKDSREYRVCKYDGYEWYEICKNGKHGAENRNGILIVPIEYDKVEYDVVNVISGEPAGFYTQIGAYEGYYNLEGKCIIPYTRHYTSVSKHHDNDLGTYYQCEEDGAFVLCDIKGKEVCRINLGSNIKYAFPMYRYGKFFFNLTSKDDLNGLADGNGKVIIPPTEKGIIVLLDEDLLRDTPNGSIKIGKASMITTTKNPLANNPKEGKNNYSPSSSFSNPTSVSNSNANNSSGSRTTQTVVVEHHRDPVPVQEWQQCVACFGSGQCPYVKCGGSGWYYIGDRASTCGMCHGSGKCSTCAGKGGHYVTVYR